MHVFSIISLWVSLGIGHSFVNRPALRSLKVHTRKQTSCRNTMTMYFDDLSRSPKHTIKWYPKGNELTHIGTSTEKSSVEFLNNASNEKLDAIKRLLLGYDAESASRLSDKEVIEQMELWAEKSGVVGDLLGDEMYAALLGMTVCTSTTLVGCIAHFWQSIVQVVREYSDEFKPVDRWTITKSERPQVFMVVFPNCKDLYDYKTMTTLNTAMEFSKDLCLHLGQRFTLTLFHPKYKNSPKMLSPARHSPFPCSGLHFEGEDDEFIGRMLDRSKPRKGYVTNDRQADDSSIPNLKRRRVHLEILFNSAAASSSADELHRDPVSRNMSQRFPKELVVEMSELWIDSNRFTPRGTSQKKKINRALQFADTVDGRWTVSNSKIAEEVYAEVWSVISDLYDKGQVVDREPEDEKEKPVSKKFSQLEWMKSLSQPFHHRQEELPSVKVISAMFASTKFCAFNAQGFKSFAITVNAALKRLTNGQMFLEVFHPEYVGNQGYDSKLRRSPFPLIQICYEIRKTSTALNDEVTVETEEPH